MIGVIVATVSIVLAVVFAAASWGLTRLVRAARAERDAAIERGTKLSEEERSRYRAVIDGERASHEKEIEYMRERHTAEIERLNAAHSVVLERLAHTIQYGTPTPQPAAVKDAEPDAESRLIFGITEDMVKVGGQRIKRMYEDIGQVVSIEECEAEARAMLHGVHPDIPPERMGLAALQDGPTLVKEPT